MGSTGMATYLNVAALPWPIVAASHRHPARKRSSAGPPPPRALCTFPHLPLRAPSCVVVVIQPRLPSPRTGPPRPSNGAAAQSSEETGRAAQDEEAGKRRRVRRAGKDGAVETSPIRDRSQGHYPLSLRTFSLNSRRKGIGTTRRLYRVTVLWVASPQMASERLGATRVGDMPRIRRRNMRRRLPGELADRPTVYSP
ncbi:hypothetical protein AB1N83_008538 [Pleurotus pulmonarius]